MRGVLIMAVGSISSYLAPTQGYFNSNGTLLNKYMTSLYEQKKTPSQNYFNQNLFGNLSKVGSSATLLQSQISSMASLNQYSVNAGKTASYTDKGVLSANVAKNATVSNFTKTSVNVSQLASAQENKSAALKADENSFGNKFSISITDSAGKKSTFDINISDSGNNKTAMQSMADAVNKAGIGIKASLVEDKGSGTVSLQFAGTKTGDKEGKFTVEDTSAASLANIDKEAQNASYSVNGVNYNSQSNSQVKIIDGVTADLNKTGSTEISYKMDTTAAAASAQKFIDSFNSLKDAASSFPNLIKQLDDVARNYSKAMGFSGLGMDKDGKLSIVNSDKLSSAISDGSFARNFQGIGSLGNKLTEVARNAYKTSYSSAVDQNFKEFLNYSKPSSGNNWSFDLSLTSGLLFNMRI